MKLRKRICIGLLITLSFTGCKKEDQVSKNNSLKVTANSVEIPNIANSFLNNYYPDIPIKSATTKEVLGFGKTFQVALKNHAIITFDEKGQWKEISDSQGVDKDLLPIKAMDYISQKFPEILIVKLETRKNNTKAHLSNSKIIEFDETGNSINEQ